MLKETNFIQDKTFDHAVHIVQLTQHLQDAFHDFILSKQLLRSGTSIGANVRESKNAQSRADFVNKLNIALKEADETGYWLELLYATQYIDKENFEPIYNDNKFIIAILTKIIKSMKEGNE